MNINIIRSFLFSIAIPATVSIYLPIYFWGRWGRTVELGIFNYLGILVFLAGLLFYLISVTSFIARGGTPQIYFMKKLEKVFGIEPDQLSSSGVYKLSRNPMYFGVFLAALGNAIFLESLISIIWAFIFWFLTHLIVVFIEEPHLKEKYGDEYAQYLQEVPRWLGRRSA